MCANSVGSSSSFDAEGENMRTMEANLRKLRPPGTSSLRDSSINLMKNCVGAGVFSLSSRVNAVSTHPHTLFPASALVLLMATWATYNFCIIGETCELTDSFSYPEAWGNTVSLKSQWIVTMTIVIAPIVSCLANSIVLVDILGLIMRNLGLPLALYGNRNTVIAILSTFILFPLCSLKDLSALKSVSAFGILGQLVAMATLAIRLDDKSYFPGGQFFMRKFPIPTAAAAAVIPSSIDNSKWFVLASILSYCMVSHYNAPRYYSELKRRSPKRFLTMASISYALSSLVYIVTMTLGVKVFGARAQSFLLNNFAANDPLGLIARVAFGSSVLASFPLIFLSMRNWFITLAARRLPVISGRRQMTFILLTFISCLAVFFRDIGVVSSIAGGILGSSVMFIFPPIMYIGALLRNAKKTDTPAPRVKIGVNVFLMLMGGCLAFFGTYVNLSNLLKAK